MIRSVDGIAPAVRCGSFAAAQVHHHPRGEFEAGHAEVGVDAALEPVAGVGVDAQLAAGLGDVEGIPECGFDEHVGGALVAAGMLSAHDAGDGFNAFSSAMTTMSGVEP